MGTESVNDDCLLRTFKPYPITVERGEGSYVWDAQGCAYNINADTLATAIATAMKCDRLVFASDIDGIHDLAGQAFSELDVAACRRLIEGKVIRGGMVPKMENALAALGAGVPHVRIINGLRRGSLRQARLSDAPTGTCIRAQADPNGPAHSAGRGGRARPASRKAC